MKNYLIISLFFLLISSDLAGSDLKKVIGLAGEWKFSIGDNSEWASKSFDDTEWNSIQVPANWEDQGYHGYDGYGWYRKEFSGAQLQQFNDLFLQLGYIDDADEVFLNGKLIGMGGMMPPFYMTGYHTKRIYHIPSEHINYSGRNVIAVRVFDARLGGGMSSGNIGIYYQPNDFSNKITLEGVWELKLEGRLRRHAAIFREWNDVMVPKSLTDLGIQNHNGVGFYRKTFKTPAFLPNQDLVLLLGKIDDFDEVYLNDQKIGQTNDGKHFGDSQSWQKPRVYPIPNGLLRKDGKNEIVVKVTDIGVDMGIYQGPIAIVPKSLASQYVKNYYARK